jgi:hypothetical protein
MDGRSPTSALIIGKEDAMVLIRRALGYHGARYGNHHVIRQGRLRVQDPGKEALRPGRRTARAARQAPGAKKPIDDLYAIVKAEL